MCKYWDIIEKKLFVIVWHDLSSPKKGMLQTENDQSLPRKGMRLLYKAFCRPR